MSGQHGNVKPDRVETNNTVMSFNRDISIYSAEEAKEVNANDEKFALAA